MHFGKKTFFFMVTLIPAIQAAMTQLLRNISLDNMKESTHKLVDCCSR